MSNYKDLQVWKASHELVIETYKLTKNFPKEERYELISQLNRAVVSIPANIAEGTGRRTNKDFCSFLHIARGSLNEVEYYYILSKDLGYINEEQYNSCTNKIKNISRKLNGLIKFLTTNRP
jgi:four helix bundle protein